MLFKLLLLFTLVPLLELYLLIVVGREIGPGLTIAVVAVTGAVGVLLAKSEGLAVWRRFAHRLESGDMPGDPLLDGLFILVGGAFLLTPGLITDGLGFVLLLPITRAPLKNCLKRRLADALAGGSVEIHIRRW